MTCSHKVSGLTPRWCAPTRLCCRPVDHRVEETRWESFEADLLVGIVRGNLHQVVPSIWANEVQQGQEVRCPVDDQHRNVYRLPSLRQIEPRNLPHVCVWRERLNK